MSIPAFLRSTLLACLSCAALGASAATINVNSISTLQSAINGANPGDIIIMANGSYSISSTLNIARAGNSTSRITIKAATVGGVTISGSSGISFASPAAFVTLEGFVLTHASSINIPSSVNHIRVTRCTIDLNIAAGGDVSYINISGDDVEIDRNELKNKNTLGEMLDIAGSGSQVARRLWVHHNYFHDFTSPGGNGAETIRWGLSGLSLSNGQGICEYNLFVNCNGENEMISNKSSGNIYRYNTMINSNEMSQRHGDNCQYYGNYIRNSEGIRIYGDSHQVFSNYLEGNTIGITIGNGDGDVHNGDPLTAHDRPDNCVITFNTFVNNTTQFTMNGRTGGLGATNTTFANNIISGGTTAVNISSTAPYTNPVWSGNIIWNAGSIGNIPAGGYSNVNPLLSAGANGVFHIQSGSPAVDSATGTYTAVTVDMDGQPRPSSGKDKGADEISGAPILATLLTTADVGPASGTGGGTVAAPTFNPGAGTFTNGTNVTLSSTTSGASIRYTTDGSTPTSTTGTLYSGPVNVAQNLTLKAIAFASGMTNSSVTSGTYTVQCAAPSFSPGAGTYTGAQSVTITTGTSGASIRYTTDGSTPSSTAGTLYGSPVSISTTTTLKAIAFKTNLNNSTVTSGTYTINGGGGTTTITSANGFVNTAIANQTGTFTAQFDASSSVSPANAVIGLSSGAASGYTGIACMVRFNTTGQIDARNGGGFTTSTINFSANTTYHFRLVVNISAHTYSAFVTAPGGSEQTIGTNLAFRTEQAAVTNLNNANFNVNATPGGSLTYSAVSISGGGGPGTQAFEAESLSRTSSGATTTVQSDVNTSGGSWISLDATAANQFVDYTTPSIPAGTYSVQMSYKTNNNRGILNLKIDGTQVGSTLDQYQATPSVYPTATFGNVTFSSAGTHVIRLTTTGKNAASTSFVLSADKFTLVGQ